VVTVIGYNFGHALTGAILTESVFGWPGLGSLFITAVQNRDYPVLEGIFLFTAITVVGANLITDLLYTVIDPRVRPGLRAAGRGKNA
jgi:ABC-type dipeptide/oligopeptide/nickel transport system permease component